MKYIFIGDRINVLKEMIELNCDITGIFVVKDSFLEKEAKNLGIPYKTIINKPILLEELNNLEFDCLVSNGCPYILPISNLKNKHQFFINIHPSLLPDLKGKHPINGALLFGRKHGVTCHHMDDGIDTGEIIANIEIPITQELELGLLYQLSFIAEGKVFRKAFNRGFKPLNNPPVINTPIYYSRCKEDLLITEGETLKDVLTKVRAFGIGSQCARFYKNNKEYKIISAKIINNDVLDTLFSNNFDNIVLCLYESKVLVRLNGIYVEFGIVDSSNVKVGDYFFGFSLKNDIEIFN